MQMASSILIQSAQNQHYKQLLRLFQKARERKKTGLFVVEGARELKRALASGFDLQALWLRESFGEDPTIACSLKYRLENHLFDKTTQRSGSETHLGVFVSKTTTLATLKLPKQARILVAEAPEKPGNIGALLRTAAAAGLDAVMIANPKTDIFNPQAIRNSLGGIFAVPIIQEKSATIIQFLKENNYYVVAAALANISIPYTEADYPSPLALVVGTEDKGLEQQWLDSAHVCVTIPMQAPIDSLNVSVAAGILVFHALRA